MQMLQHPSERTRSKAAAFIIDTSEASSYDCTRLLLKEKGTVLGLLLKLLASDDSVESRCCYANLLGAVSERTDQAGLKHIQDAGAIPLVLELHKQAMTDDQKLFCMHCLLVRHLPLPVYCNHCCLLCDILLVAQSQMKMHPPCVQVTVPKLCAAAIHALLFHACSCDVSA